MAANNHGASCALTARHFTGKNVLQAVHPSQLRERNRTPALPRESMHRSPLPSPTWARVAITTASKLAAYLPHGRVDQAQQLLTRSSEKCDGHKTRPCSDGPCGSTNCTSGRATA